jgi:hypothetical protein
VRSTQPANALHALFCAIHTVSRFHSVALEAPVQLSGLPRVFFVHALAFSSTPSHADAAEFSSTPSHAAAAARALCSFHHSPRVRQLSDSRCSTAQRGRTAVHPPPLLSHNSSPNTCTGLNTKHLLESVQNWRENLNKFCIRHFHPSSCKSTGQSVHGSPFGPVLPSCHMRKCTVRPWYFRCPSLLIRPDKLCSCQSHKCPCMYLSNTDITQSHLAHQRILADTYKT